MPSGVDAATGHSHNWRGGRTVTPDGYVLLYLPDHHLADVRGYVYEHRVVAERMLGRPLRPGEKVHHGPGGRADNREENLTVCGSRWEHRALHRKKTVGLRDPGEPNPSVACECGCGTLFLRYDSWGRPRRFVSGHNPQSAPTREAILLSLRSGPLGRQTLADQLGMSAPSLTVAVSKLIHTGELVRLRRGVYALAEGR